MKTEFIDRLYSDFNVKTDTIMRYLKTLESGTIETTTFLAKYVAMYEKLFTSMQNAKQTNKIPNDSQFAFEHEASPNIQMNIEDLKALSSNINSNAPMVEYKFEELLKNLQFLTQSFQNYQDLTNKILESWNGLIEGSQE